MLKRIFAIAVIFCCASLAWMILAASIWSRTSETDQKLKPNVSSTWGTVQEQAQPFATYEEKTGAPKPVSTAVRLAPESTRVNVDLALDYRQKGLLWYGVYVVNFNGVYRFVNSTRSAQLVTFEFTFPSKQAIYDGLTISLNGQPQPFSSDQQGAAVAASVAAGETAAFQVAYRSQGLESWRYNLGADVTQTQNFELTMHTNFLDIDFPSNTLSPNEKMREKSGWQLTWRYRNLISGFHIGLSMPEKLQPGPLAGEISQFAPVSLLLFFFVLFILMTLRQIDLHPMNYFFLAAAFFAFHLLLAYSVDHISVELAFVICSLVSVFLVISYLRLVIGSIRTVLEVGAAQFVYLVLFSYTFFLKGFTGLAITIGCILTLFVAMQATGQIRWSERFAVTTAPRPGWMPESAS